MSKQEMNKIIDKIKKLMALGQSPSEAEASSAITKAHNLLKEYNLQMADLKEKEEVDEFTYLEGSALRSWKILLLAQIAKVNFCFAYRSKTYPGWGGHSVSKLQLIGKNHNIEVCKMMIEYLFDAIERLSKLQNGKGKSFVASYKIGISDNLIRRLQEMEQNDKIETSNCYSLVVQENSAIQVYIKNKLNLKKGNINQSRTNGAGYAQGVHDGNNINLHRQVAAGAKNVTGYIC